MYSAKSTNGGFRWDVPATGQVISAAISRDGKTAFYGGGSFNNYVVAVDTASGATKWTFAGDTEMVGTPCIGLNGEVFIGGHGLSLYSINPTNGQSNWRLGLSSQNAYVILVDEANRIFFGLPNEGRVCAVDGNTGAMLWSTNGLGTINNSCALGNDGNLYVAGTNALKAFRASDGVKQMEWYHGRKQGLITITREGMILLQDDKLTALRVAGLTAPGNGPWPVFKHDPEGSSFAGETWTGTQCSPHKATATAILYNGFLVDATITDGGCGYTNPPAVLIQGGGGSGATATAVVSNGMVVKINITDAGADYTSVPKIVIGSPPFVPTLSIAVSKVKVTQNVVLGRTYVLESSPDFVTWTATGPQFTAQDETLVNEFDVELTGRYFRIRQVAP